MKELWRPVVGYEGYYEVSDQGRVRSVVRRAANGRVWPSVVLKRPTHPSGYLQVHLSRANSRRTRWVHLLVLTAFAGPAPAGLEALHHDGDRSNARLENLKWGTRSENMLDQVRHGTHPFASRTHCPKGHPYDESNTYHAPGYVHRKCRTCMRAANKRTNERRRAERAAKKAAA